MAILVLAEHDNQSVRKATLHVVAAAQKLGGDVNVLVAGHNCSGAARAAAQIAGVAKVLHADAAHLGEFLAENVAALVAGLAKGYSHVLAPATSTGKDVMPRAAALLDVQQISEIVACLKSFDHQDGGKPSEFSVQEGLENTLVLTRSLLKNRVEVRREFGQVPRIHGMPAQINQVFLNLITNAVQAIPEGRAEPGVITLRTLVEGRDMLRVEVRDNGIGIPDDVLPRIFDPFFTTRAGGQGTGMSLAISFKIVQEHGGMILVDTVPGTGTVFSVLLPVRPRRGAAPQAAGVLASA